MRHFIGVTYLIFSLALIRGIQAEETPAVIELQGSTGYVFSAVFSPDGKKVAATCVSFDNDSKDYFVGIWDADSGKELQKLEGHTGHINSVVFSPNGKKILTASWDKTARIWDAETGKELRHLEWYVDTNWVYPAVFSPCGKKVVTASENHFARIWDADSGKELQKLEGHTAIVRSALFSPDGKKNCNNKLG
jgi:WD40 repeat protein